MDRYRLVLLIVCTCLVACGDQDQPTGPGTADQLTIVQGDGQTVYLGARARQPITAA